MPGISEFTSDFFDASSAAWLSNKKRKDSATYVYVCGVPKRDGTPCGVTVPGTDALEPLCCVRHRKAMLPTDTKKPSLRSSSSKKQTVASAAVSVS
jgi:hypothetical protein